MLPPDKHTHSEMTNIISDIPARACIAMRSQAARPVRQFMICKENAHRTSARARELRRTRVPKQNLNYAFHSLCMCAPDHAECVSVFFRSLLRIASATRCALRTSDKFSHAQQSISHIGSYALEELPHNISCIFIGPKDVVYIDASSACANAHQTRLGG